MKSDLPLIDDSKSLEQLENDYWGEPGYDSYVVTTCHSMRKKPLSEVTAEELRLVIGQGFSLDYLIPMAIEILKKDILTEGDLFEGALLTNVVSERTFDYWRNNKERWEMVIGLIQQNNDKVFDSAILKKIGAFKKIND